MSKQTIFRKLIVAVVALFIAGGGYYYYRYIYNHEQKLTASGTIEVTKYEITPKLSGYIRNLNLNQGDSVTKDQLIAQLDRDDIKYQNASSWQAVEVAKAKLLDLQKGAREQEMTMAKTQIDRANAVMTQSQADLTRAEQLFAVGGISKQELDNTQKAHAVASEDYNSAIANYDLIKAGTRADQIAEQQAQVQMLIAQAQANQSIAKDIDILSPADGVIISKNFENNEFINQGNSLLTIADLRDCWIRVYISTADLGKIALGQKISLYVDAYPQEKFSGTIVEINDRAEFTPRQSITQDERANMVFGVKIQLPNDESKLKAGMPGDVIFDD